LHGGISQDAARCYHAMSRDASRIRGKRGERLARSATKALVVKNVKADARGYILCGPFADGVVTRPHPDGATSLSSSDAYLADASGWRGPLTAW